MNQKIIQIHKYLDDVEEYRYRISVKEDEVNNMRQEIHTCNVNIYKLSNGLFKGYNTNPNSNPVVNVIEGYMDECGRLLNMEHQFILSHVLYVANNNKKLSVVQALKDNNYKYRYIKSNKNDWAVIEVL